MIEFDPQGPLPEATTVLEASAGTGKTHTIATLAARYLAEGRASIDGLLLVTFSREASRELRSRVRERFVELLAVGEWSPGVPLGTGPRERLARALLDYDRATIMTIHEFCQAMFAGLGILTGAPAEGTVVEDLEPLLREVAQDLYLARYAADTRQPPFPYRDRLRDRSVQEAGALTLARDALFDPAAGLVPAGAGGRPGERVAFAGEVRRETEARKRRQGLITFDDLLLRLRDALTDPVIGPDACDRLRSRFAVVLVDEFQDTDPVQWDILRSAFDGHRPLVLIGDPKQAIYAFRGADVRSYLAACRTAGMRATLSTNYRADGPLVAALDLLFDGLSLGEEIEVPRVRARHAGSRLTLPDGRPVTPVRLRTVADRLGAAEARGRVRDDLVRQVRSLLAAGMTFDAPEGPRPLRPSDVGVLVRTNARGRELTQALRAAGVPVAFSGSDSIYGSEAAQAWTALLQAMANPRPREVRLAQRTPFFGRSLADLARADEDTLGQWIADIRRWERLLTRHGVAALYAAILAETDFATRVLAAQGGDRLITDSRHLAQLLHQHAGSEPAAAARLAEWLAEEGAAASAGGERTRRLETDAHAVQVKTIHKAKGLQFAVVFLPDLTDRYQPEDSDQRLVFHDDDRRVVDVGGLQAPGRPARFAAARAEDSEDSLRTLYVALTRARSQVTLWWTRTYNTPASPLHRLLFRDRAGGTPEPAYPLDSPPGDGTPEGLGWLVGHPGISVEPLVPGPPLPPATVAAAPRTLRARRFAGVVDPHWRRTSYSGLTAAAHGDAWFDLPESLGLVEDERADDGDAAGAPGASSTPMAALPGGTAFGSLVHAVFEELDPELGPGEDPAALLGRLQPIASRLLPRFPLPDVDAPRLAAAMLPSLLAPLGPLAEGRRLADFPAGDRLCELDFEMPTAERGGTTLGRIADLLDARLSAGDPLAGYAQALRSPALGDQPLRGFLTGSIDAVLRYRAEDGTLRHVVVDYKTNRLPDYGAGELTEAMIASHYPLQALLYEVALHRFLVGRLAGYRPADHLGGALYLFVRGMGAAPGAGVFSWRPPAGLVEELSWMLSGEGAP